MVQNFASDAALADMKSGLLRDGAIVIEQVASDEQVRALMAELSPYFRGQAADLHFEDFDLTSDLTDRAQGIIAKAPTVVELLMLPALAGLAEAVLSRETKGWSGETSISVRSSITLSDTLAISVLPGAKAQKLHRDDVTYHISHPAPESQILFMIALSDFTEENGSTRIIQGSHLWDDDRAPLASEADSFSVSRGSCIVWLGSTYHGAGANNSLNPRTGLALVYCNAFLRQVENQYLAVPKEIARTLPPDVQALIGYSMSEPMLGYYELKDPATYLES